MKVDHEIHGCPVNPRQVLRVLLRLLLGTRPDLPGYSVCLECKRAGNPCLLVSQGVPCLGPVTRAGCGALCPSLGRDCYGCFGPSDDANPEALALQLRAAGHSSDDVRRRFRGMYNTAAPFRACGGGAGAGP